jgi:poly-gamma-glutamate capsule biosynthesis protein CapA/YwtB (metallophosphatase superfamily)
MTLFLCGDVMTGRGIDQILPHPGAPELHEPYVRDARDYVALAAQTQGAFPPRVDPAYIWGDALAELDRVSPGARIVNLETSVTRSASYWKGKGIHYRMHPENIACLTVAGIDVCALANNHVLDYGYDGLTETLEVLAAAGIRTAGAGLNREAASRPAVVTRAGGRLFVWSVGLESSGVFPEWAAAADRPGVDFLDDLSDDTADALAGRFAHVRRPGDVGIVSIHWDGNWGYDVPSSHVRFARRLIDGGLHVVHGHSSHHPRPIEVYRGRLILYGCGDFLDDYEGIGGREEYRDDLVLMYFPAVEPATGRLSSLGMTPMRIRQMRLNRASASETEWLRHTLTRNSSAFGCRVDRLADGTLALQWADGA